MCENPDQICYSAVQMPFEFSMFGTASFENFITGENTEIRTICHNLALDDAQHSLYLWGQAAVGKSHLLHAVCNLANQSGMTAAYIPLKQQKKLSSSILDGLDNVSIICVDDIDCIAEKNIWELALFNLYNQARENHQSLLMTGSVGVRQLSFQLDDLASRIGWDLIYHLQPLSDNDKIKLLQKEADTRQFTMPTDVAMYLVRHMQRDVQSLLALLDTFDHATLSAQKKLTIPFVQSVMREHGSNHLF